MAKGQAVKKYAEDEVGRYYVFEPLYKAYEGLGHPEFEALDAELKERGGYTGFWEVLDQARMRCYAMDKEYWDAHQPEWAKSAKKSQKASKMAKSQAISKADYMTLLRLKQVLSNIKETVENAYEDLDNLVNNKYDTLIGGPVPNGYDFKIMGIRDTVKFSILAGLDSIMENCDDGLQYEASTKKSKYAKLHKALNKIGGFTKEDDEEEIEIDDDDVVEIEDDEDGEGKVVEIESEETHAEEIADGEESEDDNLNAQCKGCKSAKAFRTSKRVKMKKGEDMPADADDFQNDNQKGSGNAGSELPEDADDQQDENDPGSGNAGSELPEDADDQEDQKQARARKQLMTRSRNKNVRKFSVTPGGSPNQESYAQRYSQAPMVREAISRHFPDKADKSFDEVAMLQERIDNLNKSKRNKTNNGVPQKLRRY